MEMNCYGSGSSGERKKGCSGSSGDKVWEGKEIQNCYISGSGYRVIATSIYELEGATDMNQREGGVFDTYDLNSNTNGPSEDLIHYAQLAIASYNKSIKRKSQRYTVMDIIRSEKHGAYGYVVYLDFTAKLRNQDAITFRARLWEKFNEFDAEVTFIGPISEEEAASKPLSDTPRSQ